MDRFAVTQHVWGLAEPLALGAGLEVVDVQYRPEGGRVVLRLLTDRPGGGVTLDDLTRISRELSVLLDAHDAVPGSYTLECSSPGLNRPLIRARDFQRALGQRVHVRTRAPLGDRRQFRGTLEAVDEEGIIIRAGQEASISIAFTAVERANVEYDFARPAGPHQHA